MPRDGSGNFTLPANTQAVSGDPISSTKFNTLVQDLEADANTDRPIVAGGTGASTASAARTNLGLAIGTDVQAFDAGLLSIAGLTTAADRSIYTTASDTYAVYTLTAAGRAILDDADAAAQRTTLGLGTAALKNTGTSGDAVPLLDQANTFSAAQIVNTTGTATTFTVQRTDDGTTGAIFDLNHISASPAANDAIATFRVLGRDSAGNVTLYGRLRWILEDPTDGSEDGYWTISSLVAGAETSVLDTVAGVLRFNTNTIWHAGNDGPGSGLDADTVDGAHVGTSGATIPLLNGANTFSAAQTLSSTQPILIFEETDAATDATKWRWASNGGTIQLSTLTDAGVFAASAISISRSGTAVGNINLTSSTLQANSNTVWHAGNDGAGSGLDADTLDGVEGSGFARLSGAAFTGACTITATTSLPLNFSRTGSAGGLGHRYTNTAGSIDIFYTPTGTNTGSLVPGASNGVDLGLSTFTWKDLHLSGVIYGGRQAASAETSGTLTSASANRTIQLTGDITIDNAVFAAGDIILIYAGASARTITEGASVTMRLGGTATTGSRTLAARGVAMLFFVSASEVVVSGGAVT